MAQRDEIVRFIYDVQGDKELAATATTMLKVAEAGGNAQGEVGKFTDELRKLSDQAQTVQNLVSLKAAMADTAAQIDKAKATVAGLQTAFDTAGEPSKRLAANLDKAKNSLADLEKSANSQQAAAAKLSGSLEKNGVDTTNLAAANTALRDKANAVTVELGKLADKGGEAGGKTRDLADQSKRLGDESRNSSSALAGLGDHLGKIAIAAGAAVVAFEGLRKASDFAGESFSTVANVEQSLSRVQGLAQGAADDFAKLSERVDEAAAAANVSVTQSAAAAAALAEQGQSAKEIYQSLIPTMLLAKDANIEVAQAAGLVDDSLDRFGLSADQAGHVVDVLVTASKGAKDGLAGMSDAMGKLAPLARDIGLDFDQTATILGLFAQNGISASAAGKGLKSIFEDLSNPTSKLRNDLLALGDGGKDFDTALKTLTTSGAAGRDALNGLSGSAKTVMLFLAQQGPEALAKFSAGIANADGAAQSLRKTLDDNLKGAWQSFSLSVDTLGEKLATPLLQPLRDELTKLAGQLTTFAESPAFNRIRDLLGKMFEDGIKGFDDFIQSVQWDAFVADAETSIGKVSASVQGLAGNLGAAASAINTTASVIGTAFHAVEVVLTGVAVAILEVNNLIDKAMLAASKAADALRGSISQTTVELTGMEAASRGAAEDGLEKLRLASEKVAAGVDAVSGTSLTAGDAVSTMGEKAAQAESGVAKIGEAAELSAQQIEDLRSIGPPTLQQVADAANKAAQASTAHAAALDAAASRFAAARAEMDRLATSGDGNAEAFRKAQIEYQAAGVALDNLRGHAAAAGAGADDLRDRLDKVGGSSQSLAANVVTATDLLDKTFAAFQAGSQTLGDVQTAFDAYAAAQRASVANSEQWAKDQVEANLRVKESLLGLGNIKPPDTKPIVQGQQNVAAANQQVIDTSTTASRAIADMGKSSQKAGEQVGSFATIVNAYAGYIAQFNAHSEAAGLAYQRLAKQIFDAGTSMSISAASDGTRLVALAESVSKAAELTQKSIDDQESSLQSLVGTYSNLTEASLKALTAQYGSSENLIKSLREQAAGAREGKSAFTLLGQADLSPLAAALESAASKVEAIKEQAKQAKTSLEDMASSLQEQIFQIQGDMAAAENLSFQRQIEKLKEQATAAGLLQDDSYRQAVQKATELHNLKLKQIAEQAAAAKKSEDEAAARKKQSDDQAAAAAAGARTASKQSNSSPAPQSTQHQISIDLNGTNLGNLNPNDPRAMDALARTLLPKIVAAIRTAARNTGGFRG